MVLQEFRDGHFPVQWAEIKAFFETLKPCAPDLVLTHYGKDLHQDHRVVSELAWNTFRDQLILEYEIPKWDGGLGSPNLFVPASVADADAKIAALMRLLPDPGRQALVRRPDLPRPDAPARPRMRRARGPRRGLLRPQGERGLTGPGWTGRIRQGIPGSGSVRCRNECVQQGRVSEIPEDRYALIIGAMKCATTSLFSYLAEHPAIAPAKIKEPEFFSRNQAHRAQVARYEDLVGLRP